MPTSAFKKSYFGSITDIIEQQQSFRKKLEFNSGISAAIASMSYITKAYEMAMPKKDILSLVIGNSALAYLNSAQKQENTFNSLNPGIGITGLAQQMSQMQKIYNRNDLNNVISPMLQIQDSLNTLYKSKSAFTSYNNLFKDSAFVSQMNKMQVAILGISGQFAANASILHKTYDDNSDIDSFLIETSTVAANIAEDNNINFEQFEILVNTIGFIVDYIKKHPSQLLDIIFFKLLPLILAIIPFVENYHKKDEIVQTNELIERKSKELDVKFQQSMFELNKLLPKDEIRYCQHSCFLKLKYCTKSLTLTKIDSGQEITVIKPRGKWLKVSVIDDSDESEITGWVLKKYFRK